MTSPRLNGPGLWAVVALALGGVSLGARVLARQQRDQWQDNPDPLGGRSPRFPTETSRVIETDDGAELATFTAGSGPAVLLVHGLTGSSDDWGPIAERLIDDGCQVIAIDQRGHGRSTLGRADLTPRQLGTDLAVVIEALDLHRCVLVGYSLGGMAAQSLAVHHRELAEARLCGLALIATSARLGGLSYRFGLPLAAQLGLPLPQSPIIGDSTLVLGATALSAFGTDPSLFMLRRAVEAMARCPAETRQAATAGMVGFDLADEIADITLPTLVLCGTRDLVLPFSHSERVAAAIPGAELIALPNAGHLVVWERPAELATHITRLVHQ